MVGHSIEKRDRKVTAALLAVQVFYGLHYLAAKWIVAEMEPGAWAVLRTGSALLIMAAITLFMRRRLPPPGDVALLALCAFFGIVLNQALFLEGIARTTAAHSALINSQIPSFALLWALVLGHERLSRRKALSFLVGMTGVLILLEAERFRFSTEYLAGDLLTIGNAASFGLFLVISRNVMRRSDPVAATLVVFFFGALGLSFYGAGNLAAADFSALSARAIASMIFAVLAATLATYYLNLWSLKRAQSSRVALFVFLQPLIASVAGLWLLDEIIGPRFFLAALLVIIALVLRDESS